LIRDLFSKHIKGLFCVHNIIPHVICSLETNL
jgi:hypothetical protein